MPPISFHKLEVTSTSPSPHPPPQPSPASSSTSAPTNSFSVKCYLHQKGSTPGVDKGMRCEETFGSESDLMTHMAEVHGGNLCYGCEKFGCQISSGKTSHCYCKKCVTTLQSYLYGTVCYPSNWYISIISCGTELSISYYVVSAQSLWTLVQKTI